MAEEQKKTPSEKITLYMFVDDNYKLITCMAAFIALAAFSSQLNDTEAKTTLAGCALLAVCLFAMELFFRLPVNNQHWRLWLFELVMLALTFEIGRYFFLHFPVVWGPFAGVILNMLIFLGPPLLLGSVADWVLRARTQMNDRVRHRVAFSIFAGSFLLIFILVQIGLSGHPISIHVPKAITDLFSPRT